MALSFSQLIDLIAARLNKPLIGQKITAADVKDVTNAVVNFTTNDGNSLPPYVKPNVTTGKIPQLSTAYQLSDSAMSHFMGLGGGVRLDGAWRVGANCITKTELFQPASHATNRYETTILLPKGAFGNVTLQVSVRGIGQSSGVITKTYTFDASTVSSALSSVYVAQGDIVNKIFLGEPDWTGTMIALPIHERSAVNVAKIYVVEVSVAANDSFLNQLMSQNALLSSVTITSKSTSSQNVVIGSVATQMSISFDGFGVKLVNDVTSPNMSQFYGTNGSGTRGWYDQVALKSVLLKANRNRQTTSYTLALADAWGIVEQDVATANTVTIPPNSSVAFEIDTACTVIQLGAGQVTIVAGAGVTLRTADGKLKLRVQYSSCTMIQRAINDWYVIGDTTS